MALAILACLKRKMAWHRKPLMSAWPTVKCHRAAIIVLAPCIAGTSMASCRGGGSTPSCGLALPIDKAQRSTSRALIGMPKNISSICRRMHVRLHFCRTDGGGMVLGARSLHDELIQVGQYKIFLIRWRDSGTDFQDIFFSVQIFFFLLATCIISFLYTFCSMFYLFYIFQLSLHPSFALLLLLSSSIFMVVVHEHSSLYYLLLYIYLSFAFCYLFFLGVQMFI